MKEIAIGLNSLGNLIAYNESAFQNLVTTDRTTLLTISNYDFNSPKLLFTSKNHLYK